MLSGIVEVKIHLPGVGVSELPNFYFDEYEASQPSMEEEEIHAIPFDIHCEPLLTGNECKVIAQFQQELFELSMSASSNSASQYSSLSPRNSSTNGSLISNSGIFSDELYPRLEVGNG
jgi:hypothetical protein